jgi:hypothetical protein
MVFAAVSKDSYFSTLTKPESMRLGLVSWAHQRNPHRHGSPTTAPPSRLNVVNFEQTPLSSNGTVKAIGRLAAGVMASIVPFISDGVFESADTKVISDAYSKAINLRFRAP